MYFLDCSLALCRRGAFRACMTCITTSCSYNIGSELQLLATSTDVFVFDSSLTLTLALTLDCNKGSLLRASGLVDLQSIILRKFENPCEGKSRGYCPISNIGTLKVMSCRFENVHLLSPYICTGEMLHSLCFLSVNEMTSYHEVGPQE